MTVGILALQGDFREHEEMLHQLGVATLQVRLPRHLEQVERLIIPGGESTTIGKLLVQYDLIAPIRQRAADQSLAIWGTCAGAILMAQTITGGEHRGQPILGIMDIAVRRNAFGRQIASFEADMPVDALGSPPLRGVFIRAPSIESVGEACEVLARLPEQQSITLVRQGRLLAATFHSELTSDNRLHQYFLSL
jgi:5'-phosphate synthase pdxT subunit